MVTTGTLETQFQFLPYLIMFSFCEFVQPGIITVQAPVLYQATGATKETVSGSTLV